MASKSLEGHMLGRYRVLEPLGSGGMARVYRAYHPQLDRYVAIKVLRSDLVEEAEFLARFRREAQSVANLRHPNIVQVFDFDVQDDVYFMVMELLQGDTLKARLSSYRARGESMPPGDSVRVLLDSLDGLGYAHGEGMVHRDLKPANLMLTGRGQAVLTDFGIAQIVGGTQYTASGALMGTLNYMAPEQGLQKGDARSDLYSMGIVLYEMFTGRPPFDADTPLAILLKHLNDPLPLPRMLNPDIPEPFERIMLKALSKRPEDRYQSAAEMAQALRDAAAEAGVALPERISLPPIAPPPPPDEPVAVYSGTARADLTDAPFAADDTDTTLSARLATDQARQSTARPQPRAAAGQHDHTVVRATLGSVSLIVGYNLAALTLSGIVNNFAIFNAGWPLEIMLVGLFLSVLMDALDLIWLLIPSGAVLVVGAMLAFFRFTLLWERWAIWALVPLLLGGLVALTVVLGVRGYQHSRRIAQWLILGNAAFITISVWLIAVHVIR